MKLNWMPYGKWSSTTSTSSRPLFMACKMYMGLRNNLWCQDNLQRDIAVFKWIQTYKPTNRWSGLQVVVLRRVSALVKSGLVWLIFVLDLFSAQVGWGVLIGSVVNFPSSESVKISIGLGTRANWHRFTCAYSVYSVICFIICVWCVGVYI